MSFEFPKIKSPEMKKENSSKPAIENNEKSKEKEIFIKENNFFGDVWGDMILGEKVDFSEEELEDSEKFKSKLFSSLMESTGKLIEDWGIKLNEDLIGKLKLAKSIEEKTKFETEYINWIWSEFVEGIVLKNMGMEEGENIKYKSSPAVMKDKKFNCVGASMLGVYLLEKAGIKSYLGNPPGHALNIIQLSNKEWRILDLRNGSLRIIDPNIEDVDGMQCLKFTIPGYRYQFIPLYNNESISENIIGNIGSMLYEIKNNSQLSGDFIGQDKAVSREDFDKYVNGKFNFSKLAQDLYPEHYLFLNSKQYKKEKDRLRESDKIGDIIKKYLLDLPKEESDLVMQDLKNNKASVEDLFYDGNRKVFDLPISEQTKKHLNLLIDRVKK